MGDVNVDAHNARAVSFFYKAGFHTLGHIELLRELQPTAADKWKPALHLHGHDFLY